MRYLLVTYVRKGNGQIDEQVGVSTKVKPTDIQMCNIIMDFKDKAVMKAVIESASIEKDWDKLYAYYQKIYPAIIERLEQEASQE
jgi:hypothetical protein